MNGHGEDLEMGSRPKESTEARPCKETALEHVASVQFLGFRPEKKVSVPAVWAQKFASLGTPYEPLNWAWGFLITLLYPAAAASVWFACVKTGNPYTGDVSNKAVWVFLVNPVTGAYLSFLILMLFFTSLDRNHPWRPLSSYFHILVMVYLAQVIYPGLYVILREPHTLMGVPTIALTYIVTLVGLRLTPHVWFDANEERFRTTYTVFRKISIVFVVYMAILGSFLIANVNADGSYQGFLTFALSIITFIFKKILLAMTDKICIETAMLIAGFWVENLGDLFISLALPTTDESIETFTVIFVSRVLENTAYLGFQTEPWFKFRIWIKGKFKKSQATAIEEDVNKDDRGHSAQHPGYRRRQLRFLVWKFVSQLSSYVFFLITIPALRYGPNKRRFPFTEASLDRPLDEELEPITRDAFVESLVFAAILTGTVLVSGMIAWSYMQKWYPDILTELRATYAETSMQVSHYALIVTVMVSNALVAVSFLSSYSRVYYYH